MRIILFIVFFVFLISSSYAVEELPILPETDKCNAVLKDFSLVSYSRLESPDKKTVLEVKVAWYHNAGEDRWKELVNQAYRRTLELMFQGYELTQKVPSVYLMIGVKNYLYIPGNNLWLNSSIFGYTRLYSGEISTIELVKLVEDIGLKPDLQEAFSNIQSNKVENESLVAFLVNDSLGSEQFLNVKFNPEDINGSLFAVEVISYFLKNMSGLGYYTVNNNFTNRQKSYRKIIINFGNKVLDEKCYDVEIRQSIYGKIVKDDEITSTERKTVCGFENF